MGKKIIPVFIVIIFSFLAGFALLHPGLPPTHDGEYHVIRFYEFDKTFRSGVLYPRWAFDLNNGYGLPLFNYVYPLPNYVAVFFHTFNISFIDAFKFQMFFAMVIGSLFFYYFSKYYWGAIPAVVGSIFYTFAPYHLLDMYIRGSVGEVWALAFFPGFLWSVTIAINEQKARYAGLSSAFLALVILSHNILGLLFFCFAIAYVFVISWKEKKNLHFFISTLSIFLLSLGISAIFWLPALIETQFVKGLQIYDPLKYFPQPYQLLIPSWGSGFSETDIENRMSLQIGLANLLIIFLSLIYLFKKIDKYKGIFTFFVFCFFLFVFLMTPASTIVWRSIPFFVYVQFPWRLLSLIIVVCSFLAAAITQNLSKGYKTFTKAIIATFFIGFCVLPGISYAHPAYYHYRDDFYYVSRPNFIDGTNSPGNLFNTSWIYGVPPKTGKKIRLKNAGLDVHSQVLLPTKYAFNLTSAASTSASAIISLAYFPGWNTYIDGKLTKTTYNKDGMVEFMLPSGRHTVALRFEDTFIRSFAQILSILTVVIVTMLLVRKKIT